MGPEAWVLSINVTSASSKNSWWSSCKKWFWRNFLFTTFYVTTSCFSRIRFVIILSTPKLVNCFTSVLFTTDFATQQVDKTFAVTVKIMIDFICRFSYKARKSINSLHTFTYLTLWVTTPMTSYFSFNRVWPYHEVFYFPSTSARYYRSRWKNYLTSQSLYKNNCKFFIN